MLIVRIGLATLFLVQAVGAQDWPQWRGPKRDGSIEGFIEPAQWPPSLRLRWKTTVGEGHSTPVVSGNRIYVLSRQQDEEVVSCVNLDGGKILWQQKYAAPVKLHSAARSHGNGPKSTPLIHQGRLYTLGISGILSSFDLASGMLVWRKDFSREYKAPWPEYGAAMSPLGDGKTVVAHLGGVEGGALTAFDAGTGDTVWRWDGDGPSYASPIIAEFGGARHIVTQSRQNVIGISSPGGRLLWRIPFTTAYAQNVVTPLAAGDLLVYAGYNQPTVAVRVAAEGGNWSTRQVWENKDVSLYMNSPVLAGNAIYAFSQRNKGQLACLDARTGKTLWVAEGRGGENASLAHAGKTLFVLNNDADLILVRKNPVSYEELRRYRVAESSTWAHPVVTRGGILIKDQETLALWGIP